MADATEKQTTEAKATAPKKTADKPATLNIFQRMLAATSEINRVAKNLKVDISKSQSYKHTRSRISHTRSSSRTTSATTRAAPDSTSHPSNYSRQAILTERELKNCIGELKNLYRKIAIAMGGA